MIHRYSREQLEVEKYNACIFKAQNSRIYAYSWYLDAVCDDWEVLVKDDYEAVMPLPVKRKLLFKFIYQPYWTQQLGIFYLKPLTEAQLSLFLKTVKTPILYYNFNSSYEIKGLSRVVERTNYEIELGASYTTIALAYRKDRKKSLKKALDFSLGYNDAIDIDLMFRLYKRSFQKLNFEEAAFKVLKKLLLQLNKNHGFQRNIYCGDELVAFGFFATDSKRIYYIFGASTERGKDMGATTFLIDSVLKEFSETDLVFDFEGSSSPSIGNFYKSFGAADVPYGAIKLPKWLQFFKQYF